MPKGVPTVPPYQGTVRYSGGFERQRSPNARAGLQSRALNPHVFYQLSTLSLVKAFGMVGMLGPR